MFDFHSLGTTQFIKVNNRVFLLLMIHILKCRSVSSSPFFLKHHCVPELSIEPVIGSSLVFPRGSEDRPGITTHSI